MKYTNPDIESSYRKHDLGQVLYDLVLDLKPKRIVEFGALHGYSTVAMAMALDQLGRGKIDSYDLWKKYPYTHSHMDEAELNVRNYGLERYVQFYYGDAFTTDVGTFDLLHIDISNDGDKLETLYKRFKDNGRIVFEGGSLERDQVEWMTKYKRPKISTSGVPYILLADKFPSLSIITL